MIKDIPYSELKRDERSYVIMLLRDQYGNTFTDIAKEYELSVARVLHLYHRTKLKQASLYIQHVAAVLGLESTLPIKEVFNAAYECYHDRTYACAYLEMKYQDILTEYRDGEPGVPPLFLKNMPPLMSKLSETTIVRVVELRDVEKASFVAIAKELGMTQAKAKYAYDWYYHKQVMERIKALQEKAESKEEKAAIWNSCFGRYQSPKKRYDMLTKE